MPMLRALKLTPLYLANAIKATTIAGKGTCNKHAKPTSHCVKLVRARARA
jgi:hypothetical protein